MTAERWLPVAGTNQEYEVSDLGRVRSWRAFGGKSLRPEPRVLGSTIGNRGYKRVTIRFGTRVRHATVHSLVAQAFHGDRPEGQDIRHLNGDRLDNRAVNLRYGTRLENILDSIEHGTHEKACRDHCKRGHVYDERNTRFDKHGRRVCRACQSMHMQNYKARRAGTTQGASA